MSNVASRLCDEAGEFGLGRDANRLEGVEAVEDRIDRARSDGSLEPPKIAIGHRRVRSDVRHGGDAGVNNEDRLADLCQRRAGQERGIEVRLGRRVVPDNGHGERITSSNASDGDHNDNAPILDIGGTRA